MYFSTLIYVILTCIAAVEVLGKKVSLNGSQFIPYTQDESRPEENHISLRVKTINPSGVLVYGRGIERGFLLLEIVHGRLRFVMDLGRERHELLIGYNLANSRWHSITVYRIKNKVVLTLDGKKITRLLTGSSVRLDLQKLIYVGGLDKNLTRSPNDRSRDIPNLFGCLSDVFVDYVDVLRGAINRTQGQITFSCRARNDILLEFPSHQSYVSLSSVVNFSLHLRFRTYTSSGLIAYKLATNARVFVSLVDGVLKLKVKVGNYSPLTLTVGRLLNDGMWHDITSGVNTLEFWLSLDGKPEVHRYHPLLKELGNFRNRVFIGGSKDRRGFTGCMHDIRVNQALIATGKPYKGYEGATANRCNMKSVCLPNPCMNGGTCKQQGQRYTCDCGSTFFGGYNCKIPQYRATCVEYKVLGLTEDSHCKVNPKRIGGQGESRSFLVLCNMTSSYSGITIVTHNKNGSQRVSKGTSTYKGYHYHAIIYVQANIINIKALISQSIRCRQYISFSCYNTTILNPQNVQWMSSNGLPQNYWGGASPDSQKCACAVSGTCVDRRKVCNCDVGDAKWREDKGYITDMKALPVSLLKFNHRTSQSMFTLGPLECFGFRGRFAKNVTSAASLIAEACRPVRQLKPTLVEPSPSRPNPTVFKIGETGTPQKINSSTKSSANHVSVTMTTSTFDKPNSGSMPTQDKNMMPPLVTAKSEPAVTTQQNNRQNHSHNESTKIGTFSIAYIIAIACVAFVIVVLIIILFVWCSRATSNCCRVGQRSNNERSFPDKELDCRSIYSGPPEDVRPDSMEIGTYNINSGQWIYQSINKSGNVKKFVTFSPATDSTNL